MTARKKLATTAAFGFVTVLLSAHMALGGSGQALQDCSEQCFETCQEARDCEGIIEQVPCEACDEGMSSYAIARD